jgi:hypothetical protein
VILMPASTDRQMVDVKTRDGLAGDPRGRDPRPRILPLDGGRQEQ